VIRFDERLLDKVFTKDHRQARIDSVIAFLYTCEFSSEDNLSRFAPYIDRKYAETRGREARFSDTFLWSHVFSSDVRTFNTTVVLTQTDAAINLLRNSSPPVISPDRLFAQDALFHLNRLDGTDNTSYFRWKAAALSYVSHWPTLKDEDSQKESSGRQSG
jgi:hypothetical protein